ncbi:MAG: SusF/SusE family outer membrane protein, partial [Flavobacterium sp.]
DNLSAAAGFYYIKADTQKLTYSTTLTKWGIIGDATPGGWDADTALTYDPLKFVWSGVIVLKGSGELKFRANNGWDINFGSDKADGIANAGGPNIPTPGAGTYKITLDLSHSRAYTYKLEKQ